MFARGNVLLLVPQQLKHKTHNPGLGILHAEDTSRSRLVGCERVASSLILLQA